MCEEAECGTGIGQGQVRRQGPVLKPSLPPSPVPRLPAGASQALTVPTEPQEEDAEQGEGGVVAGHVDGLTGGVKAANARAQHPGGSEGGDAAHHVDRGVACKVVDTRAGKQDVGLLLGAGHRAPGGQPAEGGPHPVGHHGVHKQHDHQLVQLLSSEGGERRQGREG